jgi:hypothetical protein
MAGLGEARVRTAVAVAILVAIPGCPNRWVRRLVAHEAIHNPNQGPDDPAIRGPEKRPSRELSPVDEAVRAMTLAMDEGVGSIVAKLRELGLDKETLVIFISAELPAILRPFWACSPCQY